MYKLFTHRNCGPISHRHRQLRKGNRYFRDANIIYRRFLREVSNTGHKTRRLL